MNVVCERECVCVHVSLSILYIILTLILLYKCMGVLFSGFVKMPKGRIHFADANASSIPVLGVLLLT